MAEQLISDIDEEPRRPVRKPAAPQKAVVVTDNTHDELSVLENNLMMSQHELRKCEHAEIQALEAHKQTQRDFIAAMPRITDKQNREDLLRTQLEDRRARAAAGIKDASVNAFVHSRMGSPTMVRGPDGKLVQGRGPNRGAFPRRYMNRNVADLVRK